MSFYLLFLQGPFAIKCNISDVHLRSKNKLISEKNCKLTDQDEDAYVLIAMCSGLTIHRKWIHTRHLTLCLIFIGEFTDRLYNPENGSLYFTKNETITAYEGYLQDIYLKRWEYFDFVLERGHEIVCKSFSFKYHYYTGKFLSNQIDTQVRILNCSNHANLSGCNTIMDSAYS